MSNDRGEGVLPEEAAIQSTEEMVQKNWKHFAERTGNKEFFHNPEHFLRFKIAATQYFFAVYGPNLDEYHPENDLFGLEEDRLKLKDSLALDGEVSRRQLLALTCVGAFTHDVGNSALDIDRDGNLQFRPGYEVTAKDAEPVGQVINAKWLNYLGLGEDPIVVVNEIIEDTVFADFGNYFPERPLWRVVQMIDQVGQAQYPDRQARITALKALSLEFQRDGKGKLTPPQLVNFPFARIKMFLGIDKDMQDPAFFLDPKVATLLRIWPGLLLEEDNGKLPNPARYQELAMAETQTLNVDAMRALIQMREAQNMVQ